ncbi:MAG: DUF4164 family protein [Beijerinckiaceae bacterium]
MTEPVDQKTAPAPKPDLDGALARLQAALTVLEIAAARRREADLAQADLAESLAAMQDDRARLALDLDEVLARARKLETANDEVATRLEAAGLALKGVLDAGDDASESI